MISRQVSNIIFSSTRLRSKRAAKKRARGRGRDSTKTTLAQAACLNVGGPEWDQEPAEVESLTHQQDTVDDDLDAPPPVRAMRPIQNILLTDDCIC